MLCYFLPRLFFHCVRKKTTAEYHFKFLCVWCVFVLQFPHLCMRSDWFVMCIWFVSFHFVLCSFVFPFVCCMACVQYIYFFVNRSIWKLRNRHQPIHHSNMDKEQYGREKKCSYTIFPCSPSASMLSLKVNHGFIVSWTRQKKVVGWMPFTQKIDRISIGFNSRHDGSVW